MQLDYEDHFKHIVLEAWQAYLRAEGRLTHAVIEKTNDIEMAAYAALREGAAAALFLHHFAEVVIHRPPGNLPGNPTNHRALRIAVNDHCTVLRSETRVDDVHLLGDVADALKHSVLRNEARGVSSSDAVLVTGSGYGAVKYFGEGKWGGIRQVLVLTNPTGTRALSSILQNVIDAWRKYFDWPLPDMGAR